MKQDPPPAARRSARAALGLMAIAVVATVPAQTTATWTHLAWENEWFAVSTTQTVRYGANTSWVTKSVIGAAPCTNTFFGTDPARGVRKSCQRLTGTTSGTTTPTPTTPTATAVTYDASRIPPRNAGVAYDNIQWTGQMGYANDIGAFRLTCEYSHMAADDPIVLPNQPGKSHLHTFFGNTGVTAASTATSIATTGASTCRGGTVNRSAYWVPTLIDTRTGTPLKPASAMIYYKTGYGGIRPSEVRTMPPGLRMIAGDARNARAEGPFRWACVGKGSEWMSGTAIQNCPVGARLWQMIYFPQCWDGANLDAPDHKSHMSYPVGGRCPATHPVALPEVSFNVIYEVAEANAPRSWRLSSDTYDRSLPGGYSSHGDWFNGWKVDVMKTFVERCDRAAVDCHANLLGDGRSLL